MAVRIIADTAADPLPEVEKRLVPVPMTVIVGGKEYREGVDIDKNRFYSLLETSAEFPKTCQITEQAFDAVFAEVANRGDKAVAVIMASSLSGTYVNACRAAEKYGGSIEVVDSGTVTIGAGVLAEYALTLADGGASAREIAAELTARRDSVIIAAVADTLEYLKKGGRISAATAFAGGLLSIKPVVGMKNGSLGVWGKVRGARRAAEAINRLIDENGGVDFSKPYLFGYTGTTDDFLRRYLSESTALWEGHPLRVSQVGSIVGSHVGPGAFAVAFFAGRCGE